MNTSALCKGKEYGMKGRGRVIYQGAESVTTGYCTCRWEYVFVRVNDWFGLSPISLTAEEVAKEIYNI